MAGSSCGAGGSCILRGVLNLLYIWTVTSALIVRAFIASFFSKVKTERKDRTGKRKKTVAFFHPYCNAGGGGERVLWAAVRSLQQKYPSIHTVIFTGDRGVSSEEIIVKAKKHFNISVDAASLEFVFLRRRHWVESDPYPLFTLLGQSLGSLYLGLEALYQFNPDVYLDTMGYAFNLPLFKYLGGARVGAYVHYPTISTDMLQKVAERSSSINNSGAVANSAALSTFKLLYYRWFAWAYSKAGRCSEVTMVNSSWTEGHILQLWQQPGSTYKVYPPCDVTEFRNLKRRPNEDQDEDGREPIKIISVAQFRPEKDHALQIKTMAALQKVLTEDLWKRVRLVLRGSVRNDGDQGRVDGLRQLAKELGVEENVEFQINFAFQTLKEQMVEGLIGIHSMWNEHFGISVVDCLASGLLMIAHKSGGPLMDIVTQSPEQDRTGFLAETPEEYAQILKRILTELSTQQKQEIRKRARKSVDRFSDENFGKNFLQSVEALL